MKSFSKIISLALGFMFVFSAMPIASSSAASPLDLTVTMVSASSSVIYDADDIKFNAVIRNIGTENLTEDFSVNFYVNGVLFETVNSTNDIAAGGMTVVGSTKEATTYFGTHKITATVNTSKTIDESDFNNNLLKARYLVRDEENPMKPTVPKNPTPLSVPKSDILDAADGTLLGTANMNTENNGYTGDGYAEYITENGDGIEFSFDVNEAALYEIKIRYANGSPQNKSCGVIVNGNERTVNFEGQTYWNSWKYYTFTENLQQGRNIILVKKRNNGDDGYINIDSIEISRVYDKRFSSFAFLRKNNPTLDADIICEITDKNYVYAYVPSDVDLTKLVATYQANAETVKVLGTVQQSGANVNDFTNGHIYILSAGGNDFPITVILHKLKDTSMPNVFVNFDNTVSDGEKNDVIFGTNKDLKVSCMFTVKLGKNSSIINSEKNEFTELTDALGKISLRGNSTLHQPKKSWKIKLEEKSGVLDMPKSKHWILLASYDDKSQLRQYTGYELARNAFNSCGYSAPRVRFCNLFMNGKYNGVYLLMEQPKLSNGKRVNADSMEDFLIEDPTNLTGGYLLELDSRQANYNGDEDPAVVFTAGGTWFVFKDPDEEVITAEMKSYMADYIDSFVATLEEPTTGAYEQYIDVDSFVDWYLTMEIMKNLDAAGNTSIYCYKVRDGKLFMGPVWDFDISSGNVNYSDSCMVTSGWHIKNSFWYKQLFEDPKFVAKVKSRYQEFRNGDYDLLAETQLATDYISDGMQDNFVKWDYLSSYFWPEPDVLHTHDAYATDLYNWLDSRLTWLDENIPNL